MADGIRFWDRIAEKYARQPVADEAAYRRKLALTQQYLTLAMTAVEFGCGTGTTAFEHAPHVRRYTALDAAPKMIAIAERRQREAPQPNLEFAVGTIEDHAGEAESVDVVLCLNLLHLLRDREAALRRVAQLLQPGGLFVSSTVCLGERMGWLRLILPLGWLLGLVPQVWFFSRATLRQEIEAAGFTIVEAFLQDGAAGATFFIARKGPA